MLRPDWSADSVACIDWDILWSYGIKVVLLDIDNTLVQHGTRVADARSKELIDLLQSKGFETIIISNAKSGRAAEFAKSLGVDVVLGAQKPRTRISQEYFEQNKLRASEAVMVGDQLFTDIWFAKNFGCLSVLVLPLTSIEPCQIRVKRVFERLVGYQRKFSRPKFTHFGKSDWS